VGGQKKPWGAVFCKTEGLGKVNGKQWATANPKARGSLCSGGVKGGFVVRQVSGDIFYRNNCWTGGERGQELPKKKKTNGNPKEAKGKKS